MLARVAARSLRSCRTSAPAIQPVLPYIPFRSYAKNNKPKPRPYDLKHSLSSDPANRHGSNAQKSAGTAVGSATNQADSPTSQIKDPLPFPNPSKLQAEYDSIMSSRSGAPNPPPRPNPDPLSTYPGESRLLPDFSNLRESSTSTPSDGRTTPQSTSPSALDHSDAHSQDQLQSSQRLPDLTQGIPSTLDSEVSASSVKADPASLNITEDPSQPGGPGDLPKSAYISSMERRRDRIARWVFGGIITFVLTGVIYFGRNWDTEDEEKRHVDAPSGWGLGMFWNRIKARYRSTLDYYNEPAFPKLLPNTDPLWERPYTLVLSLEDMLVHSEWSREHGWRMAKRPGVDYFLRYLSQYYELVIFTSVPSMIGLPITKKLDPYQIVLWPLFREATRYQKGEYIKARNVDNSEKHAEADIGSGSLVFEP